MSSFNISCEKVGSESDKNPFEDNNDDNIIDNNFVYNDVITIMPIGDSLTEENTPGYRGYLYKKLIEAGLKVDFVGVKSKEPSNGGDPDHSGYSGFVIGPNTSIGDDWAMGHGNIFYHLDNGYKILSIDCSVIILMIGINDFYCNTDKNYNPEKDGAKNLDALIGKIFTLRPDVSLFVSDLTPVAWDMTGFAQKFNSEVPGIVEKYVDKGHSCYFVNMRNGNKWDSDTDFRENDGLHLTSQGYEKVSNTFYNKIMEVYNKANRE